MATLTTLPANRSFLSNNKFDFVLRRIPNFTYFVQAVNLPSLSLQSTTVNTPFSALSVPGNQISFGTLSLTFIVDEDMQSWYELYSWIFKLGNPKGFDKRGGLKDKDNLIDSVTSDATLFIKTNANNPNFKIEFYGAYPTELGDMQFSSVDNQEFITSTATFNYTYYEAEATSN
jgi:hypothetical protein